MEEDAKKALAQLDGLEVGGSTIRARMDDGSGGGNQGGDQGRGGGGGKVALARPRPRGKGNGGRFDDSGRILYFTNLPLSFAWQARHTHLPLHAWLGCPWDGTETARGPGSLLLTPLAGCSGRN